MTIAATVNAMRPVHPGEVLREDYLKPLNMSANALAQALHVPASRVNDIVLERRGITVDTAMRLVRYFGGNVQSWMNLQTAYEIKVAGKALARRLEKEIVPLTTEFQIGISRLSQAATGSIAVSFNVAWA